MMATSTKLSGWKAACVCVVLLAIGSQAQTFTTLVNFAGVDGAEPAYMALIQGLDGNIYGTTAAGGYAFGIIGTVFKIDLQGTLTDIYEFCILQACADGYGPYPGLIQGADGNFYGTTYHGGFSGTNTGTIFKLAPDGTLTTLYDFCMISGCPGGFLPRAQLLQTPDGDIYGTSSATVFKFTRGNSITTLHTFCTQQGCPDGSSPYAGLVQGYDGSFYGTTEQGGAFQFGTVFKITPSGVFTTLHSFDYVTDGGFVYSKLLQASDGNLYGTTASGGLGGAGTIFKITPAGTLTTIYNFSGTDGGGSTAGLVQATNGDFYGTTVGGGTNGNHGTVFKITPSGALTTLHSFNSTDGQTPEGALFQATNGIFYGTTAYGGTNGNGTVFSLDDGLGPFVQTLQSYGTIG